MSRRMAVSLAACALCLLAVAAILAWDPIQAAPDIPLAGFSIPWWTVDNGGGASQGGPYVLSGTAGQPDVGSLSGGDFTLKSGFWSGPFDYVIHIPLTKK